MYNVIIENNNALTIPYPQFMSTSCVGVGAHRLLCSRIEPVNTMWKGTNRKQNLFANLRPDCTVKAADLTMDSYCACVLT